MKNKQKYIDLGTVYISNVRSSSMLPYSCKSNHLIKVPRIKFTAVVTNTNDVIFNFIEKYCNMAKVLD
jgi:hypothetical protein